MTKGDHRQDVSKRPGQLSSETQQNQRQGSESANREVAEYLEKLASQPNIRNIIGRCGGVSVQVVFCGYLCLPASRRLSR